MQLDFSIILDWLPAFGSALLVTLKTTVCSLILGLVISVPLSLCKISNCCSGSRSFIRPYSAVCRCWCRSL